MVWSGALCRAAVVVATAMIVTAVLVSVALAVAVPTVVAVVVATEVEKPGKVAARLWATPMRGARHRVAAMAAARPRRSCAERHRRQRMVWDRTWGVSGSPRA